MADVLAGIVERKKAEVAARRSAPVAAGPSRRSLAAALRKPGARFILETKQASPSGHRATTGVEQAARAFAPVADALSVLTDGPGFGGSLADIALARRHFDGPILAKEFIVDPVQVGEARAAGADAVLVMMSVLDDSGAAAVMAEARRLAMDAVVEVHDEAELKRALALGATIIGINNRDLKTLATDLAVTERLAPLVPDTVLLIAESGIAGRGDAARLSASVDAFLVGSSLMAAADVGQAARALVHGPVKLCGLTRAADIVAAAAAGATHAGLILVPGTPRAISPDQAAELAGEANRHGLKPVGVFRDAPPEIMTGAAEAIGLDAVQLHDRFPAATELRRRLPREVEIWALSAVGQTASPPCPGADRTLFDTGTGGGSGQAFDWALVEGRSDLATGFLAGGIGPANAAAASRVGAYGLDIGSGVESAPGVKDPARIAALFDALRLPSRAAA